MRILGTHHVAISTRDLPRLRTFYTETMGLPVVGGFPGYEIVFIGAGDTAIELIEEDGPVGAADGSGWHHLAWEVENVDEAYVDLVARGVPFQTAPEDFPPTAPTTRIAFFCDPDGNLIELIQPLGERYPTAGTG